MSSSLDYAASDGGQTSFANPFGTHQSRRDEHDEGSSIDTPPSASRKQASPSKTLAPSQGDGKNKSTGSPHIDQHPPKEQHEHHTALEHITTATHIVKDRLHLHAVHAHGPASFFHPTAVHVHLKRSSSSHDPNHGLHATASHLSEAIKDHTYLWRARDNRKGRKSFAAPALPPSHLTRYESTPHAHRLACKARHVARNLLRMCTVFAYWDISYWSGWAYSIGSILFVMDGAWAFRYLQHETPEAEQLATYGGPVCFFIGTLLYQLGAVMAYLEAVNDGSFEGSAMARVLEGHEADTKVLVDEKIGHFFGHLAPSRSHRGNDKIGESDSSDAKVSDVEKGAKQRQRNPAHTKSNFVFPYGNLSAPDRRGGLDLGDVDEGSTRTYTTWVWYPTAHALRTHHSRQIGYIACAIQLFGATLYGITGIVVLPGILSSLQPWQEEACFWGVQILASCCFLTASLMFTLECQRKWWKPEPGVLGWWIGFWAIVGSVGFLWIGCIGAASYDVAWGEYQADLGTIWGSSAYLISSLLQWYESLDES